MVYVKLRLPVRVFLRLPWLDLLCEGPFRLNGRLTGSGISGCGWSQEHDLVLKSVEGRCACAPFFGLHSVDLLEMSRSRDEVYMASQAKRPVVSSRGEA